jgi:hypothetical protein
LFQTCTPQSKPLIRPEAKFKRLAETAWIPIDGVVTSPEGTPDTLVLLKEHSLLIPHTIPELTVPVPGSTHFATVRFENEPLVSCMSCMTPFTVELDTFSVEWSVARSSPLTVTPWMAICVAADRNNKTSRPCGADLQANDASFKLAGWLTLNEGGDHLVDADGSLHRIRAAA